MTAVDVGEMGAAGAAVELLLKTFSVAVDGGVVEEEAFSSTAASTVCFTAASIPSSTVVSSTVAFLIPLRFIAIVPAILQSLFAGSRSVSDRACRS